MSKSNSSGVTPFWLLLIVLIALKLSDQIKIPWWEVLTIPLLLPIGGVVIVFVVMYLLRFFYEIGRGLGEEFKRLKGRKDDN